jgi:hypothetical protein
MYKKSERTPDLPDFALPFEGTLDPENRWVKLAKLIPWEEIETDYAKSFRATSKGEKAMNVRVALGALLIKEILGQSDRDVVESIAENPYLQFFLGYKSFSVKAPFDASLMTTFRKRLSAELVNNLNMKVVKAKLKSFAPDDDNDPNGGGSPKPEPENEGSLLMDATCAPADMKYPTDLGVVNDARECSERLIDELREALPEKSPRPRTNREVCRRRFLEITKLRRKGTSRLRGCLRFLMNALERNLRFIDGYAKKLYNVDSKALARIGVLKSVLEQQRKMFKSGVHRVEDRIVSVSQPHVRPIVRGKAGREVEFGAKITVSLANGFAVLERLSWNAYNEAADLQPLCESFKQRTGHYPEAVLADKIFRTRENLRYCKSLGIRLSGPRLGRPPKELDPELLKLESEDSAKRNAIEGKFGQCKRRLGLGRIMAKLKGTSETAIAMSILTANLLKLLEEGKDSSRQLHNPDEFRIFMTGFLIHDVEQSLVNAA